MRMANPSNLPLRLWLTIRLLSAGALSASAAGLPDTIPATSATQPSYWVVPASALAYGCLKPAVGAIGRLDDRLWARVSPSSQAVGGFHPETVLQWTPSASVYLLDAAGLELRNRFRDQLLLDAGSMVVAGSAGWVMRRISAGMPNFGLKEGTEFPSGHATNAFRGAELLRQELRGRYPVLSWSGYVMATLVSVLRMRHGQHQFSEVVAGAGLGVLSTRSVYWLKDRIVTRPLHRKQR
jgi:hypothetical protein